jgi:predicted ribosomally synthesized peptide with nif11-like leader
MSQDSIKKFFEAARTNPELRKAFEDVQDQGQFVALAVEHSAKQGLSFSEADITAELVAAQASVELNDAQLDQVAGGGWRTCGGSMDWTDGGGSASACCVGGQKTLSTTKVSKITSR